MLRGFTESIACIQILAHIAEVLAVNNNAYKLNHPYQLRTKYLVMCKVYIVGAIK